ASQMRRVAAALAGPRSVRSMRRRFVPPPHRTMPMNAVPDSLASQADQLSASVTRPIPGSRKVFVQGSRPDLRVPMREIAQAPTPAVFGGGDNPPVTVYDTSGPYSDPDAAIDLARGLPALRAQWIGERGDSVELDG